MGHKIFVSYKFWDFNVYPINGRIDTTVRDYINIFENKLDKADHIYKGESDNEDLGDLPDNVILEKLKDHIYDSSVTIVFISPGMKESNKKDRDQWIPWEISYSLKEISRKNSNGEPVTSRINAMLAVVLPDRMGAYTYFLEPKNCCLDGCTVNHVSRLFDIHRDNMFNLIDADTYPCIAGSKIWRGESSYIAAVRWENFISDYNAYINNAIARQDNAEKYKIRKEA